MDRKSDCQLFAISKGVEFALASDDPSLLSVGYKPKRLHWTRKKRLAFCTFQHQYQLTMDQLGSLVDLAKAKQVTPNDLRSIRDKVEKLPVGNLKPVLKRLANAEREHQRRVLGGIRHELAIALGNYKQVVIDIYPKVASYDQQERVWFTIENAISQCESFRFSMAAFYSAWSALDLTCLTTGRLVLPYLNLQEAMVAAADRYDFNFAIKKLKQIRESICPNFDFGENKRGGNNGLGGDINAVPRPPQGPNSGLSAFCIAKPMHSFVAVKSKHLRPAY